MKPAQIETFFRRLHDANPDPRGELEYASPFTLLVAVVLSAQATDASVNKATPALFKAADTPQKMLALGEDGIKRYIQNIGLFNMKARNLMGLCRALIETHGGEVPSDLVTLQTLPGVGLKTAKVVLNTAFNQPVVAVDTHVYRVCDRTGLARGKTREAVSEKLDRIVPDRYKMGAHHWLILHGRYVCLARRPNCPECIVSDLCAYPAKTIAVKEDAPARKGDGAAQASKKPSARTGEGPVAGASAGKPVARRPAPQRSRAR